MTITDTTEAAPNGSESPVEGSEAVPAVDSAPEALEGSEGSERKGNREARYRVERNEARVERDALAARVEQLQTLEVHRLADELAQPSDLLELGGVSLADLLNEAGDVDNAAVAEAVAALLEARPGLAKNPRQRVVDHSQGTGSYVPATPKADWGTFLSS